MASRDRIDFVTVAVSWHPVRAWLIRNKLADEGIDAIVVDEHVVSVDWLTANAVGGVKIQVPQDQAKRSADVLAEDWSVWLPLQQSDDAAAQHCQRCHSVEVCEEAYSRRAVYLCWFILGFPVPIRSSRLRCLSCGYPRVLPKPESQRVPIQYSLATMMTWLTIAACLCGIFRMAFQASVGFSPIAGETRKH